MGQEPHQSVELLHTPDFQILLNNFVYSGFGHSGKQNKASCTDLRFTFLYKNGLQNDGFM